MSTPQSSTELEHSDAIRDEDLHDIFSSDAAVEEVDQPDVVHIPVPTIQSAVKKAGAGSEEAAAVIEPAPTPSPQKKIQINIGGTTAASAKPAGASTGSASRAKACGGAAGGVAKGTAILFGWLEGALDVLNWPLRRLDVSVRNLLGAVAAISCITAGAAALLGPQLFPHYRLEDLICTPAPQMGQADSQPSEDQGGATGGHH